VSTPCRQGSSEKERPSNLVLSVVAAGIARTVYLGRVQGTQLDKTWFAFDVFLASVAECNVAIICACAPSLKFLFSKYFTQLTTKMTGSGKSSVSSAFGSRKRGPASKLGLGRLRSVVSSRTREYDNSSTTMSIGRRPSEPLATLDSPKTGPKLMTKAAKEGGSSAEAHEYGMELYGRLSDAYEQSPVSRKGSKASVLVLPDPENNMNGGPMVMSMPATPAYPGRLSVISPARSLGSLENEINAVDGSTSDSGSNFRYVAFNHNSSSPDDDEEHLMAQPAHRSMSPVPTDDVLVPPLSSPRSKPLPAITGIDTQLDSLRAAAQLRPLSLSVAQVRRPSVVAPWSEPSSAQIETVAQENAALRPSDDAVLPKPRRKLSKSRP
jgi:hypothetical protein